MMNAYTIGVDIGSRTIKIVLFDGNKVVDWEVNDSSSTPASQAKKLFETLLIRNRITMEELGYIISTGYGREQFPYAQKKVTEISCHAKGVSFLFPQVKTIIDIGGQDSKIIRVEQKQVIDFAMNDRCAAGTGRFLELLERIIEIPLHQMGSLLTGEETPCEISSMCVVFAESEIVSLLAQGEKPPNILAGVLQSIAKRIVSMSSKTGIEVPVAFTGGVAQNSAMINILKKELKKELLIPENSSITGALGAAIIGFEKIGTR